MSNPDNYPENRAPRKSGGNSAKQQVIREMIEERKRARQKAMRKKLILLWSAFAVVLVAGVILVITLLRSDETKKEAEGNTGSSVANNSVSSEETTASGINWITQPTEEAPTTEAPIIDQKVEKDGKTYYYGSDGKPVVSRTFFLEDKLYAADAEGVLTLATGWQKVDDAEYFIEANGTPKKSSYADKNGIQVYLGKDGVMVSDDFFYVGDDLFYAEADGSTRKKAGWFTKDGKDYYSDEEGKFVHFDYLKVDGKYYFMTRRGEKVEGTPYFDQYLGVNDMVQWLEDHFNDYFFKTPYTGLWEHLHNPEELIRPYGVYGEKGSMNCTGFISSIVYYGGGDLDKVAAMGLEGSYGDADSYLYLGLRNYIRMDTYDSVEEFLKSGNARKGDVIYLMPVKNVPNADCHVGVFWGDTPSDNVLWSQTYANLCTTGEITYKFDIAKVYVFPLSRDQKMRKDNE